MFSFGSIFASIGAHIEPERPALIHGDHVTRWGDLDRRTDSLAASFIAAGAGAGDKVAHLMRNSPAYLETTIATFKARMVHVNINYRYTGEELFYILDNSDAAVLVHDADFADLVAQLVPRLPKLKLVLQVGGQPSKPSSSFEVAATLGLSLPAQDYQPDDMLFIYTGGTTGMPKGVMWDQSAVWSLLGGGAPTPEAGPVATLAGHCTNVADTATVSRILVMPPLMHGTGFLIGIYTMARGGTVMTLPGLKFEPAEVFAACATHAPDLAVLVGDAFARPLLGCLDRGEGSIASIKTLISSGTMWSPEVKAGLLRHNPELMILDSLGSSESIGMGASVQTADNAGAETRFVAGDDTLVLDEDMQPVAPGSGVAGRIARGGLIPRGYYKDEAKSAATFVRVGDKRYVLAGDWATIDADGSMVLLGRGSQCINTGGEKVFPEEVEEALKTHPAVEDALVFGVADDKWGQRISAVVELAPGAAADTATLVAHVRGRLAAYKAPKTVTIVPKVPRAPNGKADYATARDLAENAATAA